jgi:hypothetical protein
VGDEDEGPRAVVVLKFVEMPRGQLCLVCGWMGRAFLSKKGCRRTEGGAHEKNKWQSSSGQCNIAQSDRAVRGRRTKEETPRVG